MLPARRWVPPKTGDRTLDQSFSELAERISDLGNRLDIALSPESRLVTGAATVVDEAYLDYRGKGADTITLPPAAFRGLGRGAAIAIHNNSLAAITLRPVGKETINGAATLSLAAGAIALVSSNGRDSYKALVPVSAPAGNKMPATFLHLAELGSGENTTSSAVANFGFAWYFTCLRPMTCTGAKAYIIPGLGTDLDWRMRIIQGTTGTVLKSATVTTTASNTGAIYTFTWAAEALAGVSQQSLNNADSANYLLDIYNLPNGALSTGIAMVTGSPTPFGTFKNGTMFGPYLMSRDHRFSSGGSSTGYTSTTPAVLPIELILDDVT